MKKTTIAAAAAVLLLAAVLFAAGCVSSTTDPVVGAWYTEDGGSTGGICLMFAEDHSGFYIYDAGAYEAEDGTSGNGTATSFFDWTADGDNAYSAAFDDGVSTARFTLNPDEKTFTTWNDVQYTKVMDKTGALSGQSSVPSSKPPATLIPVSGTAGTSGELSAPSSKPPATKYPIRDTAGTSGQSSAPSSKSPATKYPIRDTAGTSGQSS